MPVRTTHLGPDLVQQIAEKYAYDPFAGLLTHTKDGSPVACASGSGHARVDVWFFGLPLERRRLYPNGTRSDGGVISVCPRRIAWFLSFGVWPVQPVGSINGDPFDLRIANITCGPLNGFDTYFEHARARLANDPQALASVLASLTASRDAAAANRAAVDVWLSSARQFLCKVLEIEASMAEGATAPRRGHLMRTRALYAREVNKVNRYKAWAARVPGTVQPAPQHLDEEFTPMPRLAPPPAEVLDAVRRQLAFDPITGVVARINNPGTVAGRLVNDYVKLDINAPDPVSGYLRAHTLGGREVAWFLALGHWPTDTTHSNNGNPADLRIVNLRQGSGHRMLQAADVYRMAHPGAAAALSASRDAEPVDVLARRVLDRRALTWPTPAAQLPDLW